MHPSSYHNFSAGPAALPKKVLLQAQEEFISYQSSGFHIGSISHRSETFSAIVESVKSRLNRLLGLNDEFHILLLQGGATTQFAQWVMNFASSKGRFGLLNTGVWSTKAWKYLIKEVPAAKMIFDGEESAYKYVPQDVADHELDILHFTSNNTIFGTQFKTEPGKKSFLVCDASSDILSRPIIPKRYGLIYAGAQKNLGPAGLSIVLLNKNFLQEYHNQQPIPAIWDYRSHLGKLFNTPPTFSIYMTDLVLQWLEEDMGGLPQMQKANHRKADLLYDCIDSDGFYQGYAAQDSRSRMNVVFNIGNGVERADLESRFLKLASEAGMIGLKGHRDLGGIRASIYNAVELESVKTLVSFMEEFRRKNG